MLKFQPYTATNIAGSPKKNIYCLTKIEQKVFVKISNFFFG